MQPGVTTIWQHQRAQINIQSLDRLTNWTSPKSTPDTDWKWHFNPEEALSFLSRDRMLWSMEMINHRVYPMLVPQIALPPAPSGRNTQVHLLTNMYSFPFHGFLSENIFSHLRNAYICNLENTFAPVTLAVAYGNLYLYFFLTESEQQSLCTIPDIQASWALTESVSPFFFFSHGWGEMTAKHIQVLRVF